VDASKQARERVVSVSGTGKFPPVPAEHPDDDLLADLAAEVLPDDVALQVQDHVVGCPRCADLLAEAEGIRSLLRNSEPELMPDDVLERLEAALVAAWREDDARLASATGPTSALPTPVPTRTPALRTPVPTRTPATGTPATGTPAVPSPSGSDPRRRIVRSLPGRGDGAERTGSRLGRMTQTTQRARRQALEEQRADRPSMLTRLAPVLKVAASVILVLGVGGLIWQLVSGSGGGATTAAESAAGGSAAAGSAAGAPVLAQVRSTGTNYRKADLGRQVDTLIEDTQKAALSGQAATDSASGGARFRSVQPQASGAGHDLLLQPAALRACLVAIGVAGEQPVAVDLARYANRDAAIIVLNADGGGYDVWVVARDCRPGADGTIANVHLDS
jgi:hypothetical protein